jgi:hypothetical protein
MHFFLTPFVRLKIKDNLDSNGSSLSMVSNCILKGPYFAESSRYISIFLKKFFLSITIDLSYQFHNFFFFLKVQA